MGTNKAQKNNTTTPSASVPVPVTPPRKKGQIKSRKAVKKTSGQEVKYYTVKDMEGVYIIKVLRPDSAQPSFYAPTIALFEEEESEKEELGLLFFTELRDPYTGEGSMKAVSSTGKEYAYDIAVMMWGDKDPKAEMHNYVKKLNFFSQNAKDKYQYGVPKFISKGQVALSTPKVAYHYLLDTDCISLIKMYFENCDSKDEFLANEYRSQILITVFGNENVGMRVVNECLDHEWHEL